MNNKLGGIWKEAMPQTKVLCRRFPGGTKGNYEHLVRVGEMQSGVVCQIFTDVSEAFAGTIFMILLPAYMASYSTVCQTF
jgi:hypothetical protein